MMLLLDALILMGSIYDCWLGLFYIYYGGDQYCNMPPPYQYADSSVVFLLLSFIGIHFVFIWLSAFRFVEIICFSLQRRRLIRLQKSPSRKLKSEHSSKYSHQSVYESVDIDDLSKSMDDNRVMDVVLPQPSEEPHHRDLADIPEHADYGNVAGNIAGVNPVESPISVHSVHSVHSPQHEVEFDINRWIAGLYVYGDEQRSAIINRHDDIGNEEEHAVLSADDGHCEKLKVPEMPRRGTSLSEFWKATTDIVTQGFILKLSAEDFCCVCWEEFEIGNEIAKLECSHVIHKQCAVDWFSESATCPTCRVPLKKVVE